MKTFHKIVIYLHSQTIRIPVPIRLTRRKMKLTTSWILTIPIFIGASLLTSCTEEAESPLRRATDAVELTYNAGAASKISVRYAGQWSTRIECKDADGNNTETWFQASPSEGTGDGEEYQWIEILAERNPGDKRTGTIYLIGGGQERAITVTQADGHFSVTDPVISGTLKAGEASTAALDIKWDKAFGNESVSISAKLGGASEGVSIEPLTEYTIEKEGSGSLSIPISGTPTSLGELVCSVVFKMNGETKFEGDITAAVSSTNEIFSESFSSFVWGGHYDLNKPGVAPGGKQAGKEYNGTETGDGEITAGSDGAMDAFGTMTEEYRVNRGIEKWTGSKVYEHPGYLKLGTGSAGGWIMTPELNSLSSAPEDVVVSMDLLRFDNENGTYIVTAEGAGTVTNGIITSSVLPAQTSAKDRKWTTLTFNVKGATNKTRIKLACEKSAAGYRINLDNVRVMGAAKAMVTEQLQAPSVETMKIKPGANSISIEWDGIKGATSYDISLAGKDSPDFKNKVNTPDASHTFENLQPGYYFFTVKALYDENHAFDSEEVQTMVGTSGYAVKKLEAPEGFSCTETTPSSASFAWNEVNGASTYKVTLVNGSDETAYISANTSYTISGLKPGSKYTIKLKALVGDGSTESEFDSDEVSLNITTADPNPLTKPTLSIFRNGYLYTAVSFGFDSREQADSKFNIRLIDGGKVIREYKNFSFNVKYTHHGTRFIFTGLASGHTYSAQIQRISLDANAFKDSEWSDELKFTTDAAPDKSGYLLWNDFDNHPWGGNGPMMAFGIDPKEGDKDFNVITGESSQWTIASPVKNMDNIANGVGVNVEGGQNYYLSTFMPGWDPAQIIKDNNKNANGTGSVYLCAGMMKFGTGSAFGRLDFPKFTSLTGESTLEITFDASPYVEPNNTTGLMEESPAVNESEVFDVKIVAGPGTISTADGTSVNATSATLKNTTVKDMKADTQGFVTMTNHKVIVTGATAETVFSINTKGKTEGGLRMWLDNVKVKKN